MKLEKYSPTIDINFEDFRIYYSTENESDIIFLNRIRNEYAADFLHDSRIFSESESLKWFKNLQNVAPNGYWFIRKSNELIGYFRVSDFSSYTKKLMIGADIAPTHTGKGYATNLYIEMMKYLFTEYDIHKISLEVLSSNRRAINLYMKLGFKIDGIKREDVYKNGIWVDSILMSTLKSDYLKQK